MRHRHTTGRILAQDTFASDKEPFTWVLIGVEFGGHQPKAFVHAKGDTSIEELKTHFTDGEILWVLLV